MAVTPRHKRGHEANASRLHELSKSIVSLKRLAVSNKSLKKYVATGRDFLNTCRVAGISPTPITFDNVGLFLANYVVSRASAKSYTQIKSHLKMFCHEFLFVEWPTNPAFLRDLNSLGKALSHYFAKPTRPSEPATLDLINKIFDSPRRPPLHSAVVVQLRALFLQLHHGCHRPGELISKHSRLSDYSIDEGKEVIYFKYNDSNSPKCHKLWRAPFAVYSKKHTRAHHALLQYWERFRLKSSDFAFPDISDNGSIDYTKPLQPKTVLARFRDLLKPHVLDVMDYNLYSFRAGGMCDHQSRGVPNIHIAIQGHWAPLSAAAWRYKRMPADIRRQYL